MEELLAFDDVLLVPSHSTILPGDARLSMELAKGIRLNTPILSAAMDTVTESRMAIALARDGGLGVIHRNCSIADQAAEVDKVKRSESGMIVDPITLPPDATLARAKSIMAHYHISGIPITRAGKLVGILTNRDIRFATSDDGAVSDFMTHDNLVVAPLGTTLDGAMEILQKHRIEKLPLVDSDFNLKGLITVKDIQKKLDYPLAATDSGGRLLVAAAIGVGADMEERLAALVGAGVDAVCLDTAHGHSQRVIEATSRVKSLYPRLVVIAGNVVTTQGTRDLIAAGADVVKVGVGAGSICTTRVVAGVGVPQFSAIMECAKVAQASGVPVIADGGIRYSGDITKALAAGASFVMLGNLLAGLEESPGETILLEGRRYKQYRGMGSMGAMKGYGQDRYNPSARFKKADSGKLVPEGIEGRVPYKGRLTDHVYQLIGGVRSGMGYVGAASIPDLWEKAHFVRITNAGFIESHPHSVIITEEAPNYQPQTWGNN
jgi:IMP dehydrogenase